jgi:hypothetical protein
MGDRRDLHRRRGGGTQHEEVDRRSRPPTPSTGGPGPFTSGVVELDRTHPEQRPDERTMQQERQPRAWDGAATGEGEAERERRLLAYCWPGPGGVNPMTCTPAPWAMSIACITSPYLRFGAALMKSSLAGRES